MKKYFTLCPTLFLISEFFMLLPSTLFFIRIIRLEIFLNILVAIVAPAAGGFVGYNYLERYNPKGILKVITKLIISYCILEIGLVIFFTLATFI